MCEIGATPFTSARAERTLTYREKEPGRSACGGGAAQAESGRRHIVDDHTEQDELAVAASARFRRLVESVGVKKFAADMGLSTRQINRMLSGAQPNPVERIIRALQCTEPAVGDEALAFICSEAGCVFVKEENALDAAAVNAVRECAEAIAAISDGHVSDVDRDEVREAISALAGLLRTVERENGVEPDAPIIETRPVEPASPKRTG